MALARGQFVHPGLWKVYLGGSGVPIPVSAEGRCCRLLDAIENAMKPDDTNLPGMGYKVRGGQYSLDVNGKDRITYLWSVGKADKIDYV